MNTQLTSTPHLADQDLSQRVALFIQQRQLGSGARLTIEANRGVVTLRGRVPTFHQRQLLHSFVRHVAGTVQVVDELEVDLPPGTGATEPERVALAL